MPALPTGAEIDGFRDVMDMAPWNASVKDSDGRYVYVNRHYLASFTDQFGSDWFGRTDTDIWPPDVAVQMREADALALGGNQLPVFTLVRPFAEGLHSFVYMKFVLPTDAGGTVLAGVGLDLTEHARTESEHERLTAAIGQAGESVEITDLEGRITYINPAFERTTGYGRDEVIGQNPRILNSGVQGADYYVAMWATLANGQPWIGDLVNRRKDGSLFTEAVVISPMFDAHGAVSGYVAVKRDVTEQRALEHHAAALIRQRSLIATTIGSFRVGDTPEATAQAICRQVLTLPGVVSAQIFLFDLEGRAAPIGFVVAGDPDPPLRPLPLERSRHLQGRATEGPWIEPWVNRPGHPYNQLLTALGVHLAAYVPIRHEDRLIGLLIVDSPASGGIATLTEELPALVEFAELTGSRIGRVVAERSEIRKVRKRLTEIIDGHAFHPVFQPIVDLADDSIVGFEALSRFADGVPADVQFTEAEAVGLGLALEEATLEAAMAAAVTLPRDAWLALNVSPALILAGEALRDLLRRHRSRHVVLEVTEHVAIADYPAFRTAIAALGPTIDLAVDDTGAGFSSLRHILELHPAFVKLDRWLVADLDTDEARQAMIAGIGHFARSTGCRIIAEGLETQAERDTLNALGIRLAQGYLLGRPLPAASHDSRPRRGPGAGVAEAERSTSKQRRRAHPSA
jgi:PAS domain S-box-containing protein